jgi:UDP-N-acetylglucosamine--N-acetylmuramyl-(pentapeptide) pyrophosphoryl-undecaprenol N-acetylglucosamine transferase
MQRAGAARLIPEPQLTAGSLTKEIFLLLDQPAEIQAMAAKARGLAKPHAAQDIVNLIESVAVKGMGYAQGKTGAGSTWSPQK